MQLCYQNAFIARPPVVFGRQLEPLSLGHVYLLTVQGSPLMDGGPVTQGDIVTAVFICSSPFKEAIDRLVSPDCLSSAVEWGKENRSANSEAECKAFMDYFRSYFQYPERYLEHKVNGVSVKQSKSAVPWFYVIAWSLMERVSEERAWNMPLPLAFSYHAANAQFNGDEMLVPDDEVKPVPEDSNVG